MRRPSLRLIVDADYESVDGDDVAAVVSVDDMKGLAGESVDLQWSNEIFKMRLSSFSLLSRLFLWFECQRTVVFTAADREREDCWGEGRKAIKVTSHREQEEKIVGRYGKYSYIHISRLKKEEGVSLIWLLLLSSLYLIMTD